MTLTEQCRFCLDGDDPTHLITPCSCKGTFKYVHSKCLFQWYEIQPEKGLKCSVCLDELAYRTTCFVENVEKPEGILGVSLEKPVHAIFLYHLFYMYFFHTPSGISLVSPQTMYLLSQCVLHGLYFYQFGLLVSQVKNRILYREEWITTSRIVLVLLHVYLLASLERTGWVGGAAVDMCIHVYFYEHYTILHKFNKNYRIEFVSRKEVAQPQQQPSLHE
jgi:hypothetical protein